MQSFMTFASQSIISDNNENTTIRCTECCFDGRSTFLLFFIFCKIEELTVQMLEIDLQRKNYERLMLS